MFKLTLKIRSNLANALLSRIRPSIQRAADKALPKVASRIVSLVKEETTKKLHSTASLYEKALNKPSAIQLSGHSVTIKIDDPIVNALENGFTSFDIKSHMLKRGRIGKNGVTYIDVPLRSMTGRRVIRRISSNSPPSSWIHPGFKGVKIFEVLAPTIKEEAKKAVESELAAAGMKTRK